MRTEDKTPSTVLEIKRVSKTTKGKKRIRFTALVAVGDRNGRIGLSLGKASSVVEAIQKGLSKAKKNLIQTPVTSWKSIPHKVEVKQDAVYLLMKPAPRGTGIKAGSVVRSILDLAGYQNVTAKLLGSSNRTAASYAVIKALSKLRNLKTRRL